MDIIKQIAKEEFRESKSDKILIEYINNNASECIYKSITEIAEEVSLGEATITRFSKKLGFSGFPEFKVTLAKKLSRESGKNVINAVVKLDEPVKETANKLFESHVKVIEETLKNLDFSEVIKAREMFLNAKKIYFFGIGNSGIVSMEANYKFMRIGMNTVSISDSHTMRMISAIVGRGDLIFAISHSGETKEIIEAVKLAKENKANIISLTESRGNTLKDISDINISYVSMETIFETGSILSKLVQVFLIELIYAEVIKESYEESIDKKMRTTTALEDIREEY
ncbi:MurR/RpiR family transcriptional regulator [Clostridium sardiniense]|uniref:MurR/RpiR family transcriptional regulator n=1 Tax=Clostridium sardiniense TaxID=29369 RepID=A0ABS7L2K5_CLOSR|nr:MurR/RpiR family transcriptional regulator [Clostridium sardiniense]MBY0757260.1 MurR/RpiR family transcriptional regulator [Clostridium sardiniense]MDQ0461582.1 DNA-binding MurR/RpiR family transcriptional regulator [Clostridium sardiniense]